MTANAKSADNGKSRPVTLKHLAASLADEHSLTKRQNQALLQDLVGLMCKLLEKGERVSITGSGVVQVRKRAAPMGRCPATGEASRKGRITNPQRAEAHHLKQRRV